MNLPIKILQSIEIETAQATVTFSDIDDLVAEWDALARVTSRHLVVIINAAGEDAVSQRDLYILLNGDSGNTYNRQEITGTAAVAAAQRNDGVPAYNASMIPAASWGATSFGGGVILIPHAFNTVNHKAILTLGGGTDYSVQGTAGRWASANAIISLLLGTTGNFLAGSTFHLGVIDERYLVEELTPTATAIFDNIPQGEGDLVLIGYARTDGAAVEDEVLHSINDDTTAGNYPAQELTARAAVTAAASPVNQEIGMVSGANATANVFGALVAVYSQYIKGNHPHFLSLSGYHESTGPTAEVRTMSGMRANDEPVNKIVYQPNAGTNFVTGSLFSLYRVPKRIIERVELDAAAASITISNIPQNFEALILHVYAKTDRAAGSDPVRFTINGDGIAAHYSTQELYGFGAVVTAVRTNADQDWMLVSGTGPAGEFDGGTLIFPGYAETDRYKHCFGLYGNSDNSVFIVSDIYMLTDAITSISIAPLNGPNFLAGTVIELEGILRVEGLPPDEGMAID